MIYWITGKAGSGKTTEAKRLRNMLQHNGDTVVILDGDQVRKFIPASFSDKGRWEHLNRMSQFACILEAQGITVIIACVSPKARWRKQFRQYFDDYKLVYMKGGTLWKDTTYQVPTKEELK